VDHSSRHDYLTRRTRNPHEPASRRLPRKRLPARGKQRLPRALRWPGGHSEGQYTRSHPELGRENPLRQWYYVLRHGRVGRRQAIKAQTSHLSPNSPSAGWSSPVARQAHNLKVIGSNPIPATKMNLNDINHKARLARRAFCCLRLGRGSAVEVTCALRLPPELGRVRRREETDDEAIAVYGGAGHRDPA
jgi:hypothetical protein